jgi:hypothetical protein
MTSRLTFAAWILGAGVSAAAEAQRGNAESPPALAVSAPAPCRTTALASEPQLFAAADSSAAAQPAQYVERFFVAVECDEVNASGDYQIWWKPTLGSPSNSARLVAILDDQGESCDRVLGCFPAGPEFDFAVEVNRWPMRWGCYGVRSIFGAAVDEYWQCTRAVVFTLDQSGDEP